MDIIKEVSYIKNNSFGGKILVAVIIVGILYIIGSAVDASKPKCAKSGCNNEQSSGSVYCFLHKQYENSSYKNSYSSTTRATTSVTTREEPTTRAGKDNNSYKKNTSSNPYKSYDDGYDDVYMDGDYDDDRYNSDSDYADGVDDAIEDDYEEGYGDW